MRLVPALRDAIILDRLAPRPIVRQNLPELDRYRLPSISYHI